MPTVYITTQSDDLTQMREVELNNYSYSWNEYNKTIIHTSFMTTIDVNKDLKMQHTNEETLGEYTHV